MKNIMRSEKEIELITNLLNTQISSKVIEYSKEIIKSGDVLDDEALGIIQRIKTCYPSIKAICDEVGPAATANFGFGIWNLPAYLTLKDDYNIMSQLSYYVEGKREKCAEFVPSMPCEIAYDKFDISSSIEKLDVLHRIITGICEVHEEGQKDSTSCVIESNHKPDEERGFTKKYPKL